MDRNGFKKDVSDANYVARKTVPSAALWIGVFVLVCAVIGVTTWYFKVATSAVKGAGDATVQVNSAANRLQAQDKYNKLYTGIQAADANLDTFADTYRLSPTEKNLTDLSGATAICRKNVADYNQMATNALTKQWIPVEMPSMVGSDPATDCKPSTPLTVPSSK